MQRRAVMVGGLALGAGAALPRRVSSANGRLGIALVGCGNRGREVTRAMLATGRVDLVALCDVYDLRRQEARAALTPQTTPFETARLDETLARTEVDAVVVATPDHLHLDHALAVLAARKPLYLEKPATHRYDEGARLLAAARRAGVPVQTGTQQRSGAHYARAREEILARGALGQVLIARAVWADFPRQRRRFDPTPQPAGLDWARFLGRTRRVPYHPQRYETWRYFPDYGNGLLADILTHWADVAQWMMDDARPRSAVAAGGIYHLKDGRENPDTVNAVIAYDGWNLTFESSVLPLRGGKPSVLFEGTLGTLEIARDGYTWKPHEGPAVRVEAASDLDVAHARSFVEAVLDGRAPSADLETGLSAVRPVHLALAAYWKRGRARFDSSFSTIAIGPG